MQTRLQQQLALAGRMEELALDLLRPDGETVPVMLNATQDLQAGAGDIQIAVWRAVAKRAYEAEVPKARLEAAEAGRVKTDFLANVSHEIRTPLNGIIGIAGVLRRTTLTTDQSEMVDLIDASGAQLERIVSDILEIARIEAGALQLETSEFELVAELRGVLDAARLRAQEKGLAFECNFAAAAEGRFHGDAVRLKQILANLTNNALKFTDAGSVRVTVDMEEGPRLVLVVNDTGVGFDETKADKLFEQFNQADTGATRQHGGIGLGLATCKAIVDLMGGAITARSAPGVGSTFRVEAPLDRAAAAEPVTTTVGGVTEERALRVLLVEDHPTNQRVVQLILEPYGVELALANNGQEGLAAWRTGMFDLILMDLQMPVMDGLTAIRAIRAAENASPCHSRVPIAVLSANAMAHHRLEAADAGADLHIAKPVTPDGLIAGMEAVLSSSEAA